jgi:osmotically-inducible protein OsmY
MNRSTLWSLGGALRTPTPALSRPRHAAHRPLDVAGRASALGLGELKDATRWSLALVQREPSRLERMTRALTAWPVGSFRREPWLERNRTAIAQTGMACAAGATAALLFDPRVGRRRRRRIKDRSVALTRRSVRQTMRMQRIARSRVAGKLAAATHRRDRTTDYDDVTLAHKVETNLGRHPGLPKGQFNIEACDGVIKLRGEIADADTIAEIVAHVEDVQGVRGIDNLLHLPGSPAPNLNGEVQAASVPHPFASG